MVPDYIKKIIKTLIFVLMAAASVVAATASLWYNSTSHDVGSPVVSVFSFSRNLDSAGKYYCQGKTADRSGNVTAVFPQFTNSFNTSEFQVRIGVKNGSALAPDGVWIAYADLNVSKVVYGGSGYNVTYNSGKEIAKGGLYYYCAVCYNCSSSSYVKLDAFYAEVPSELASTECSFFQPNGVCDNNLLSFFYGTNFSSPSSELVNIPFLLKLDGGEYDGLVNLNTMYYRHANNQSVIAEKFRLKNYETSLNVTNATVYLKPQGSPGVPYLELRNYSNNQVLASAQCANLTGGGWVTCSFNDSVILDNSSFYYLVVLCPSGCSDDFSDTIQVLHYENTFYDEVTPYDPINKVDNYLYDSTESYYISSDDNLSTQTHIYSHVDMAFYLSGSPTNQKPSVTSVSIIPNPFYTTYNLSCNYSASDPEGQTLIPFYEWYLNGSAQNINSSMLYYKNTTARDLWSCSVQVFDGEIVSEVSFSKNVTIQDNVPPTVYDLASDKSSYSSTEQALISVHCSDAESPISSVLYSVHKPSGAYDNESMTYLSGDTYFDELALIAGAYTIDKAYCTDSAGNMGVLNTSLTFTVSNPPQTQSSGGGGFMATTEYVQNPFCGDGMCSVDENPNSCPEDCRLNIDNLVLCTFKDDMSCVYKDAWFAQLVFVFILLSVVYMSLRRRLR